MNNTTTQQTNNNTFPCTDMGNMERFIRRHRDKVRSFGNNKDWLLWDGRRWQRGGDTMVFPLAMDTIFSIAEEAKSASNDNEAEALRRWSKTSQSQAKVQSMLSLVSKSEKVVVKPSDFDQSPMQLNCINGIVDLRSGSLVSRDSSNLVSKMTNVSFDIDAQCPVFENFISEIFCGDNELIRWVQRALGYTLTGSVQEQVLFIAYGTGANGKSTLFDLLRKILGDYCSTSDFGLFLNSKQSDVRTMEAVGELKGVRFVNAAEAESNVRFSEAIIKKLTGGDALRGTKLHGQAFIFEPSHKIWLSNNHLPFAKDGSNGFWRRIKIVPFNRRFNEQEMDTTLPQKLWEERQGVLAWLVKGAMNWHHHVLISEGKTGLGSCKAIDDCVEQYRYDNDYTSRFIEECLTVGEGVGDTMARTLFEAYTNWHYANLEYEAISEAIFSRRMEERDLRKKRTKAGNVYEDVVIKQTTVTSL